MFSTDGAWSVASDEDLVRVAWPGATELARLPWDSVDPVGEGA